MNKFKDKERLETKIKVIVDLKNFLKFHRRRIRITKKLLKEGGDGRLVSQISILGLESLARVIYPNETSKTRFVRLLSKEMRRKDAIRFYSFLRCPLVHEGFLAPHSMLECWEDENIAFLYTYNKYVDVDIGGSVDYPPETLLIIYEDLVYFAKDFFKRRKIKNRILKDVIVYGLQGHEEKRIKINSP